MKKLILALLAAAGLSATAAQAATSYVGVNVGSTQQEVDFSLGKSDDSDTAFKLYGGYQFNPNFGIEAGWAHHGEVDLPLSGIILRSKARSLYAAATATYPLSQQFAVFGKLGITNNRVEFGGGSDDSTNRALWGVGASFAFTPTISGVLEYERFGRLTDSGLSIKSDTVSVGVRSSF